MDFPLPKFEIKIGVKPAIDSWVTATQVIDLGAMDGTVLSLGTAANAEPIVSAAIEENIINVLIIKVPLSV